MGKTQNKSPTKTPQRTGQKSRTSPRKQNAMACERGSGPVGRGGKIGKMGGRSIPSSSSLEYESDNDIESNKEDEHAVVR
jgi:hypothetical protein